ncbi:MAG: hypothetical protein ACRDGT_02395 [Candidatus Limnocylindria bacterium]
MRPLVLAAAAVIAVLGAAGPAGAQEGPVSVRSAIDRDQIAIGDQIVLSLVVDLAPGFDLVDPGVPRQIGDFEVVEALTVLQTRTPEGGTRLQLGFLVTSFELGPKVLPVIAVAYRGPDGETGEARTGSELVVEVVSVIAPDEETTDIKPLKPPLPVPGSALAFLERWVPAAALAVAVLAAFVLALRVRRRRPVPDLELAHGPARRALDELEGLVDLGLPEQGRTREHYERLEATLRRYAAERFGLAADARTARELRRELDRSAADRAQVQVLFDALHDAESVRYEEQVVYPARAQKTMRELLDVMRRSVAAEEYELIESGATA